MLNLLARSALLLFFFFPAFSYAAVSITEVMYNPSGADDGREWIEVYNDGASLDFSKWKLFEGGSNHGITAFAGGATIPTGGYAVLVDNPTKFLADWPNFSGQIFDTVFSGGLNNTNGETLTLRTDTLVDGDSVTYNPSIGAAGDGNSLQKTGTSWVASSPTPGRTISGGDSTLVDTTITEPSSGTVAETVASKNSYPVEPQITASAGKDRVVIAGASSIFSGSSNGLKGEPLENARYVWSFGNGERKEGSSILYSFSYPGKYVVILDVSSGIWSVSDRVIVTVVPANIAVTAVTSEFIEITNRSKIDLDLGLWHLTADGKSFTFPTNTIVLPNESVSISNVATGLTPSQPSAVSILYPNGTLAVGYGTELILSRRTTSVDRSATTPKESSARTGTAVSSNKNLAAVATAVNHPESPSEKNANPLSSSMFPWTVGLIAVIGMGVAAVLLNRHDRGTSGYTIIEDES